VISPDRRDEAPGRVARRRGNEQDRRADLPVASPRRLIRSHRGYRMKLVIAVIKPFKLDEVRDALTKLEIHGMTLTEVKGYGRQKGHAEIYRGAEYVVNFIPKVRIEVAVPDSLVDAAVEAIRAGAHSGQIGDGKIFVQPIEQAMRIRTAETGDGAL
jgi:nitrogen regulatory protein P-II 2